MNSGLLSKSNPPSPLARAGVPTRDIAGNYRFPTGRRVGQAETRSPHGSGDSAEVQTQARRTAEQIQTQGQA